jgi:hypothetical protein
VDHRHPITSFIALYCGPLKINHCRGKLATGDLQDNGEPGDKIKERLAKGGFTAERVLGGGFPETAVR